MTSDVSALHDRSHFCTSVPNLQRAWDSTSLGLLQECPRKYFYQMVANYSPRGTSIHLQFGIAYHKALEIFDHAIVDGAEHEEAVRTMVAYCLTFEDPKYDVDKYKNRLTLTRSAVWYLEQFHPDNDPYETVVVDTKEGKKPAVELSVRMEMPDITSPDGTPFLYCGHVDKLVRHKQTGWLYYNDRKTTKSALEEHYWEGFSPNTQMSGYFSLCQVVLEEPAKGGIIDAVQILVGGSRFARRNIHRTPDQTEEWLQEARWYLHQAQRYAEENYWPMNPKSCGNYGGCSFRKVCGRDPAVRQAFLSSEFDAFGWNPLVIRGDV